MDRAFGAPPRYREDPFYRREEYSRRDDYRRDDYRRGGHRDEYAPRREYPGGGDRGHAPYPGGGYERRDER